MALMTVHRIPYFRASVAVSSGPISYGYSELENNNQMASILSTPGGPDFGRQGDKPSTLKNELEVWL
jgi:hypothetical protein